MSDCSDILCDCAINVFNDYWFNMKCEFSQKRNTVDKMAMIRNRYNRTPHSRNQTRNRLAHEIMVLIT